MKRIVLFILTNVAVLVVLSIVLRLFGLDRVAYSATGLDYTQLLLFSAVVGFTGSIISLLISKPMAKWSTGAKVIDQPRDQIEVWLFETVKRLSDRAGVRMPEIAVYEGPPNAFATGAFKNSALVAVSTGLLQTMNKEEVEAVLGHEMAHVANGDMVTMMLIQGVVNTFVVFLSRVVGSIVDKAVFRSERGTGPGYFITVIVCQIVFGLARVDRRRVVLATARVSRRPGLRAVPGKPEPDDQCPAAPRGRHRGVRSARVGANARHHRQEGPVLAVLDAPAVRGADRRIAVGAVALTPHLRATLHPKKTAGKPAVFVQRVRLTSDGSR